jgi:two-component system phosphate regulon sensor histidine kinase PhoR
MARPRLVWQLLPSYALVVLIALLSVTVYSFISLRRFYRGEVDAQLFTALRLIERQVAETWQRDPSDVQSLCQEMGEASALHLRIIDPRGEVVGDSESQPSNLASQRRRPEIEAALKGKEATVTRYDESLRQTMHHAAAPILGPGGEFLAVASASMPLKDMRETLTEITGRIAGAGLIVGVLAVVSCAIMAQRISAPLRDLRNAAEQFARGDFEHRVPVPRSEEIGQLAEAMNSMAEQLDQTLNTMEEKRTEQEAVLSSMDEGILALDRGESVINLNRAAADLLEVDAAKALGATLQEVVRHASLQQFISECLAEPEVPRTRLVSFYSGKERTVRAQSSALRNRRGEQMGLLIVLHDVTQLRRLENVRRDFVANVSHELKTPITAIRGAAETLQEAPTDGDQEARFLGMISRHAARLEAIIDDLLELSRVEQTTEQGGVECEPARIATVVTEAVSLCSPMAEERGVRLEVQTDAACRARINAPLLERAVVNLVDNALKYSDAGSRVVVQCLSSDGESMIVVSDQGCGISRKEQQRIFERFYRSDAARTRDPSGSGLGLAIVKHIVNTLQGRVSMQSDPGVGSTFTIHLPAA